MMSARSLAPWLLALALPLACAPVAAQAQQQVEDSDVQRLGQRLQALDAAPATANHASLERLQARQAVAALAAARSKQRDNALRIAHWRVEAAELAVATRVMQGELETLERERNELLLEASRREVARARAEAERLRIQAQIEAEEAARMRQAAEEEAAARAEAEAALEGVSSREAAKLRAARQRAAELARKEAELLKSLEGDK